MDAGGAAGADADVELIELDDDVEHIVVTVTEWTLSGGESAREQVGRAVFDKSSGSLVSESEVALDGFHCVLAAVRGMKLIGAAE